MHQQNQQGYDELWRQTQQTVAAVGFSLDDQIGSPDDTRYGITLRLRPSPDVRNRIIELLSVFKQLEPEQYYYGTDDMHVTVLSLLTCQPGFALEQVDLSGYIALLLKCLADQPCFTLRFRGVTASPSCIMVQGFDHEGALARLRERVRAAFKLSSLKHTIDQRYVITLTHSTVIRLRHPVQDDRALLALIEQHRDTDLGTSLFEEAELVGNDWYHSTRTLQMLARYRFMEKNG